MRSPRHLMNATVEHWREATAPDGAGGQAAAWTQLGELRARASQPSQSTERAKAGADGTDITHVVYVLPADADVRQGDELRLPGRTLRVLAAYQPSEPVYLRCDCESRQPGVS